MIDTELSIINIANYTTYRGVQYESLDISYQVFGKPIGSAPLVVINHALTGNSNVCGTDDAWWNGVVGDSKLIDTETFTVLAINIPGNGFDSLFIDTYRDFVVKDIAKLFLHVIDRLGYHQVHSVIGGSLGGAIAWEMALLSPKMFEYVIPIASDWKSTDWIIAHNFIQAQLLETDEHPMELARMMAMLFYRTPQSFIRKFNRSKTEDNRQFNVESWLTYHGQKIKSRFDIRAYKLMNHLLTHIDVSRDTLGFEDLILPLGSTVIQVAVDSDILFPKEENLKTKRILDKYQIPNQYHEIKSSYGHDAFLIEFEQMERFLAPVFSLQDT